MADAPGASPAGAIVAELARAKVNLTLSVLGRRADGYHELESLVAFANLGDDVALTVDAPPEVTATGPFSSDIAGDNLAAEALRRLAEAEPRLRLGAVTIEKNLPVAAGLGGGSADAAATIRAVRRANPAFAATVDWNGVAASLGADVPICFLSTPALIWGIGDRIRPVQGLPRLPAVLANPAAPVPPNKTREVFRRLAAPPAPQRLSAPPSLPPFAGVDDLIAYLQTRTNDLAAPVRDLIPACSDVEAALAARSGCRLVRVSGAGPTCYGLFTAPEAARSAARQISGTHPGWWVRAVTLG